MRIGQQYKQSKRKQARTQKIRAKELKKETEALRSFDDFKN